MSEWLKELKYESYEECCSYYFVPNLKKLKISTLCKAAIKLYDEAMKQYNMRDQEQSFILYMKYFSVVEAIRESPEFSRNKGYVLAVLGNQNRLKNTMERTEKLSMRLRKRYELLKRSKECEMAKVEEDVALVKQQMEATAKEKHIREQKLIYSRIQYENQLCDYKVENERLKQQLGIREAALATLQDAMARIQTGSRRSASACTSTVRIPPIGIVHGVVRHHAVP